MVGTLSHALVALIASAALLVAPARAADDPAAPDGPVAQCVQAIAQVVERGQNQTRRTADRTANLVASLDGQGAPDPVIRQAAREGLERVAEIAQHSERRINALAARCLRALRDNGAPPEAAQAVIDARDRALEAVAATARAGTGAIRTALRTALGE